MAIVLVKAMPLGILPMETISEKTELTIDTVSQLQDEQPET